MLFSGRAAITLAVAFAGVITLHAQLSFEVASIRPSKDLHDGGSMGPSQLGLCLQREEMTSEVLVIEHIERPTEN